MWWFQKTAPKLATCEAGQARFKEYTSSKKASESPYWMLLLHVENTFFFSFYQFFLFALSFFSMHHQQSEQLHRNTDIINIKALSCLMHVFISVPLHQCHAPENRAENISFLEQPSIKYRTINIPILFYKYLLTWALQQ